MNTKITTLSGALRLAAQLARHARQNTPLCLVGTVATAETRNMAVTASICADEAAQIVFASTEGFEVETLDRAVQLAENARKRMIACGDIFVGD